MNEAQDAKRKIFRIVISPRLNIMHVELRKLDEAEDGPLSTDIPINLSSEEAFQLHQTVKTLLRQIPAALSNIS